MVFYYNAKGDPLGVIPQRVYRGSVNANEILFVCPLHRNSEVCTIFEYDDGNACMTSLMELVKDVSLTEVLDENGNCYNVWKTVVPQLLTNQPWEIKAQFKAVLMDGTIMTTAQAVFYVEQGVGHPIPEKGDSYEQVLAYLTTVNDAMNNAVDTSNSALITARFNEQLVNSCYGQIQRCQQEHDQLKSEIELVKGVTFGNGISVAEVEDEYSERVTANGLNIANGAFTWVDKIFGNTTYNEESGVFENARFKGITSYSENLFTLLPQSVSYGVTVNYDEQTGIITLNGTATSGNVVLQSLPLGKLSAGRYSLKFEYLSGQCFNANTDTVVRGGARAFFMAGTFANSIQVSDQTVFSSDELSKSENTYNAIIMTHYSHVIRYENYRFRVTLRKGEYTSSTMPTNAVGQVADASFTLDSEMELGKWDYVDVVNKKAYLSTVIETSITPYTDEQLAEFTQYELSPDRLSVAYKGEESVQELPSLKEGYIAFNKGLEIVNRDNSSNADVIIRQKYYITERE